MTITDAELAVTVTETNAELGVTMTETEELPQPLNSA